MFHTACSNAYGFPGLAGNLGVAHANCIARRLCGIVPRKPKSLTSALLINLGDVVSANQRFVISNHCRLTAPVRMAIVRKPASGHVKGLVWCAAASFARAGTWLIVHLRAASAHCLECYTRHLFLTSLSDLKPEQTELGKYAVQSNRRPRRASNSSVATLLPAWQIHGFTLQPSMEPLLGAPVVHGLKRPMKVARNSSASAVALPEDAWTLLPVGNHALQVLWRGVLPCRWPLHGGLGRLFQSGCGKLFCGALLGGLAFWPGMWGDL